MRTNIYKDQIVKLLKKKHLLTIAQIHKAIPNVDYSTVFRNVEQLLKGGAIKQVLVDSKSVAYESSSESHDHFICNDCGKVESIQIPHNSIKGRKIDDITVRGSCTKCNK
jgi:Fe2+ or Zn2+ uptake regulation protein